MLVPMGQVYVRCVVESVAYEVWQLNDWTDISVQQLATPMSRRVLGHVTT